MEQIGKYKVLAHIGHGAMGSVEKAEAPDGTIVAIKTLFPQFVYEDEYVRRFKREAELAKKLSHPNVVKILEIGEDQEGRRQYIVMEYIDGRTLAECMHDKGMASVAIKRSSKLNKKDEADSKKKKAPKKAPAITTFSAEETIKIIRQLAGVLQAADDIGLLHRDIKPQNILLDKKGNAKLLDFGLAKDTEALVSMLSMTGQSIGTPPYMSPEQHDGQKEIDIRSDLYSLGCTAYHMLTGKAPFPGPTASAFARQHCDDIPEPVHKVNPACPLNLSQLIDRLLAKKPKNRHHNPAELIEDLNRVERGEVPLKLYKPKKSKKHNPVRNWLTVAAAVIIVAACFYGWNSYRSNNAVTIIKEAMSDAGQLAAEHNFKQAKNVLDNIIAEYAESNPAQVKKAETLRTKLVEQHGKWIAGEAARGRQEQGVELTRAEAMRKRKLHNCLRNAIRLKNQENHVRKAETLVEKAYQLCNTDAERARVAIVEKQVQAALITMRPWAAVADFTLDKSVEAKLTGSAVAVKLEQALGQKYRLVTRNQVKKALQELQFQSSDLADKSKAKQFGKLVGAEYLISGSVIQLGREITVACQIFNIETGAIRQTAEVSALNVNDFNYMIRDAAKILGMSNTEKIKYLEKLNSSKQTSGGKYPQIAQDTPSYEKKLTIPGLDMKFIYVAPGSFMMGSNKKDTEKPIHKVTISNPYWIGKYEVTHGQYQAIMKDDLVHLKLGWKPVNSSTWHDAVEFCKKLTKRERKAGRLPTGYEYRLPTEAEWEFAARGGNESRGYKYSGSNTPNNVMWHSKNSGGNTYVVGSKIPNELGIYDMSGNVWEWCLDNWHDNYIGAPSDGSRWGRESSNKILRGASWYDNSNDWGLFSRNNNPSKNAGVNNIGFRVVLGASPDSNDKTIPDLGMKLVYVEPGTFLMGSNDEAKSKPVHKVTIKKDYWIGKYEVTQNEYQKIMGTNPSHFNNGNNKPVEQVSWNDAQEFCAKLTKKEKKAGRLPAGYEYRLPTETEWEYAARGGNKSKGYIYSGSGNINSVAWHTYNSDKQTHDVGQKMPNELGIHDMSGNVWEWCLDYWYSNYNSAPEDAIYQINKKSISHANRGGSCRNNAKSTHLAHRNESATYRKVCNLGFRVVLAPIIVNNKIKAVIPAKKDLSKTIPGLGLKLVHVEPGTFLMGMNGEASSMPLRKVNVNKAYWIGKYELTQREYQSIMGTNPSRFKGDNRPVEQVSWNDTLEFCQKLTEQEKKAGRLPSGYEYRLPTEAEWEYAARGGSKSKGYAYSGSNDHRAVAWNKYTAKRKTHNVGTKLANELGTHDMSGNVYEWCLDNWHDNYNKAPSDASAWIDNSNPSRVYRSGGLFSPARWCKVGHRSNNFPDTKFNRLGFRIVLAPVIEVKTFKVPDKTIPDLGMKLVYVAPGTFKMGSSNGKSTERPVRDVTIHKEYWIGKYEVTQNEYQKITGTNPSHFKGSNKPVEKVSWHDALNFCKKLTERERKAGRLPAGYTYQLPTEAEWEFAARGGGKNKGYKYSGSNMLTDVAWSLANSGKQTHEVGKKAANELGIHDMSGNVYEWCMDDWHNNYSKAPSAANRWGKGNTPLRVRRGGGWRRNFVHSVTYRSYSPPSRKYNYLGFRVVLRAYHEGKIKINPVSISKFPSTPKTSIKTITSQIKTKVQPKIEKKVYKKLSEAEHQKNIKNEKSKARKRMYADMKKYSKKENDKIESLYQAMYKLKDPEKTESLKKLIAKYPKANRAGCASLYLAYCKKGDSQRHALLKVIRKYGDCYYGDGTNVGADAKYFLARYYLSTHNTDKLKLIFKDLRENHPAAIHHNKQNLASLVEEML